MFTLWDSARVTGPSRSAGGSRPARSAASPPRIVALALALVAATVPVSARPAQATALDWRPCPGDKVGMQCADLRVPVDWGKPAGRSITLKLGRLPATGEATGSVLVAYGGPGGPGIGLTQTLAGQWAGLRTRMHIVTWDTRGYGQQFGGLSTGLPCLWTRIPNPAPPSDNAAFSRLADTNRGLAETCRRADPELFANMSSADNARDMEAIRKALGEPGLNFYGASYAGFYAQSYARLFPSRVRAMVLDGTFSHLDWHRELERSARRNEAAMRRFFDWCADDGSCTLHGRDVPGVWRALASDADRRPIKAGDAGVWYDGQDLRGLALGLAVQGRQGWAVLARAIRDAGKGDASRFTPTGGSRHPDYATPVTECLDWPRFAGRAEMVKVRTRLQRIAPDTGTAGTLFTVALGCTGWPVKVTNPPAPLPKGLPPLLGAGAWRESDAVRHVLAQVPGSSAIRHEGPGHTLYPSNACARDHIDRYFTDAVLPRPDTTC